MSSRRTRPSRGGIRLAPLLGVLLLAQFLDGCATATRREPISADALTAWALLEERWQSFGDLRTLADIRIRRGERVQRLTGVLLLRGPAALRFEALSPFGPPILLVGTTPDSVTVWEVVKNRAFLLRSTPDANRRWLGLALESDDLVALLSGHVRPLRNPRAGRLLPPDATGPSLEVEADGATQRIWLDLASGLVHEVAWQQGGNPFRAVFSRGGAGAPPSAVRLATLDGQLEVTVRYQRPLINSGFDPELLRVTVPQGVEIQDFR